MDYLNSYSEYDRICFEFDPSRFGHLYPPYYDLWCIFPGLLFFTILSSSVPSFNMYRLSQVAFAFSIVCFCRVSISILQDMAHLIKSFFKPLHSVEINHSKTNKHSLQGLGQTSKYSWDEPYFCELWTNLDCPTRSIRMFQTDRTSEDCTKIINLNLYNIVYLASFGRKVSKVALWSDSVNWFDASQVRCLTQQTILTQFRSTQIRVWFFSLKVRRLAWA